MARKVYIPRTRSGSSMLASVITQLFQRGTKSTSFSENFHNLGNNPIVLLLVFVGLLMFIALTKGCN